MNNIRDVARKAGVGVGTVSRVLNNHPSVRPEVRRRVQDIIRQVRYLPNVHAQRMWRRRSNTICFLLANRQILQSLHAHIIRGVQDYCASNGFSVMFSTFRYEPHTPPDALEVPPLLRSRGIVDGVILGGVNYPNLIERMRLDKVPYSIFGNNFIDGGKTPPNCVSFDDRGGAALAVGHLVKLGHQHIWFIGDTSLPWNRRRHDRYRQIMTRHGFTPRSLTGKVAGTHHETGLRAARQILESGEPCTAIFAANDYVAAGVIEAAVQKGIRVPGGLSVAGFDALDEFQYYRPGITTVGAGKEEIGEHCMKLLVGQLDAAEPAPPSNVMLPMWLIERESTAPPGIR
ncbi:MAG: LacI family DNA-binding transcriptional regulator [Bryobacteraceae bacterium]